MSFVAVTEDQPVHIDLSHPIDLPVCGRSNSRYRRRSNGWSNPVRSGRTIADRKVKSFEELLHIGINAFGIPDIIAVQVFNKSRRGISDIGEILHAKEFEKLAFQSPKYRSKNP